MELHRKLVTMFAVGLLAVALVEGKPWFCGDQDCPDYNTTYSKSYDIREYGETKWVATTTEHSKPYMSTRQLRSMFSKILPYYREGNTEGRSVSIAVPAMNKVQKIRKNVYNITMMWYIPGDPPIPTTPGVFLVTRPAGRFL